MTKRLIAFLAAVVGLSALLVVPLVEGAVHEHSGQAYVGFMVTGVSGGTLGNDVIVSTDRQTSYDEVYLGTPNSIGFAENDIDEMPATQVEPGVYVSETISTTGWVLYEFLRSELWTWPLITIDSSSANEVRVDFSFQGGVSAEYVDPYISGDGLIWSLAWCNDPSGETFFFREIYVSPSDPVAEENVVTQGQVIIPPFGSDQILCGMRLGGVPEFYTQESYDVGITDLHVPGGMFVPPPIRVGISVDVMNQGLEPIAGQVVVEASGGRPDYFELPFSELQPGDRVTLAPNPNKLWKPQPPAGDVTWTATVEADGDEFPDNDVMTAETKVIFVRP